MLEPLKPMTAEEFARIFPHLGDNENMPLEVGYCISGVSVYRIALALRRGEEAMKLLRGFMQVAPRKVHFELWNRAVALLKGENRCTN